MKRLTTRTAIAYGTLGFPIAILGYPLTLLLHPYYASELGLGLAAISTVLLITRLFDFVTDPLMGWISDRTRSPFGRRRPYLVVGLPVLILGMYKLFMPEPPVDIWYMLIWNSVMYLGWTIMLLPYSAWAAELTPDYIDRSRITATRQVFTIAGLIGAAGIIWFHQEILSQPEPGQILTGLGQVLFVLFPLAVLMVLLFVPEETRALADDSRRLSWLRSISSMLKIGPFRRLVYIAAAVVIGEASRHGVVVFFMEDVLQASDRIGRVFLLYFTVGVLGIPVWQFLAKKIGKHRSLATAMTLSAATVFATAFLGPGDFQLFLIFFVIKGLSFGAFAYLPLAMVADVVDVDTAVTRQKRAGMFYAVHGAIDKVGLAIGLFIALQVLNLSGYDPQQAPTDAGIMMLRIEYAVLPTFFFLLASWIAWNYPVTAERHEKLRAALDRREAREAAAAANTPTSGA